MENTFLYDLAEGQKRQFIDAESVFHAQRQARKAASDVRGSMFWRDLRGVRTLVRASSNGAQKSLGAESQETIKIYDSFVDRKSKTETRFKSLTEQLTTQQRLNRAMRVGRVPNIVVELLNAIESHGLEDNFMVVGTYALFAYEAAAGVRIGQAAVATRDVDILFDTRKEVAFFTAMKRIDSSLIGLLRKVDPTFEVISDQLYTAKNNDGFEVDVIRRMAKDNDSHPLRMSESEDDFWACQVDTGEAMLSARRFDSPVVATSGQMALMRTIHPLDFSRIKMQLSKLPKRDALKRDKDILQANVAAELVAKYLPHLEVDANVASEASGDDNMVSVSSAEPKPRRRRLGV